MGQVTVTLNGRTYRLSCGHGEEQRLLSLAGHVRERIEALSTEFGHAGDDRLLLMAALLVTDELFDARDRLMEMMNARRLAPMPEALADVPSPEPVVAAPQPVPVPVAAPPPAAAHMAPEPVPGLSRLQPTGAARAPAPAGRPQHQQGQPQQQGGRGDPRQAQRGNAPRPTRPIET